MLFRFTVTQNPLSFEFEAGSIAEGLATIESEGTAVNQFFALAAGLSRTDETPAEPAVAITTTDKRKRRTKAEMAADAAKVAAASAPAPAPTPDAPPAPPPLAGPAPSVAPPASVAPAAPPVSSVPVNVDIPPFLDRTVAPPAPPTPPAPPAPPAAPPGASGLASKVIAELKKRAAGAADGGQSLSDWLHNPCGIVGIAGAPFDEALAVVQFTPDEKLTPVATALQISVG